MTKNDMNDKLYCVYIMTNKVNTVLYTGVTNDLYRRVLQHKNGKGGAFTSKYNIIKLVYYECGEDITAAITREKQIKGGSRQAKIDLVNSINPTWNDLFDELLSS
jgi:putative endonuclease